MKTESAAYAAERIKLTTSPVYFVRFSHVKQYGDGADYPFSVDFATGAVSGASKTKHGYLGRLRGGQASVTPEQGRATIGGFDLPLIDIGGEVLRYLSAPALTLKTAMTAGAPGAGGYVEVNEATDGIPAVGTLEITSAGVIERVRYDQRDDAGKRCRVATAGRGADGTTAAAHGIGDPVTNGEQIRPGQRVQVFAGYAPLAEADYMSFAKMEVERRALQSDMVTWVVRCRDIQRSLRREVFIAASLDAPVLLAGNPIDIALRVLTSTGVQGANGAFDLEAAENGLATPQALVDVAGLTALRDAEFAGQSYRFKITAKVDGKQWLEENIWRSLNCYPVVLQDGKYSARRYKPAPAPGAVPETLTSADLISAEWVAGDPLIINRVVTEYDYDTPSAPEVFGTRRVYSFDASIRKYGLRPVLLLSCPGVRGSEGNAETILDDRAFLVGKRYADPPPALRCRVFYRRHTWEVGDLLKVTYDKVPDVRTGRRGLTNEVMEIVDMQPAGWGAEGALLLTLLHTGAIALPPAPSVTSVSQEQRGVVTAPPRPGGLELSGQGNGTEFTGRDIRLRWHDTSHLPQAGIDEDHLAPQVNTLRQYLVRVLVGGVEKRVVPVSRPEWEYPWERNVEDNGATGARTLSVEVRGLSVAGLPSEPATITVSNPAPDLSAIMPVLTMHSDGVLVDFTTYTNADADLDRFEILADASSPPTTVRAVVAKDDRRRLIEQVAGTTMYVRVRPYDAFGVGVDSAIANIGAAPAAPAAIAVRQGGAKLVEIDAIFVEPVDWGTTELYRHTANDPGAAVLIETRKAKRFHDEDVAYGTTYYYWIKVVDTQGNRSGFSPSATHSVTVVKIVDADVDSVAIGKLLAGTLTVAGTLGAGGKWITAGSGKRLELLNTGVEVYDS